MGDEDRARRRQTLAEQLREKIEKDSLHFEKNYRQMWPQNPEDLFAKGFEQVAEKHGWTRVRPPKRDEVSDELHERNMQDQTESARAYRERWFGRASMKEPCYSITLHRKDIQSLGLPSHLHAQQRDCGWLEVLQSAISGPDPNHAALHAISNMRAGTEVTLERDGITCTVRRLS